MTSCWSIFDHLKILLSSLHPWQISTFFFMSFFRQSEWFTTAVNQSHTLDRLHAQAWWSNGEWDVFWGDNGSFRWNNSNKRKFGNSLQKNSLMRRSLEGKKQIKELGLDQPDLKIQQQASDRGRSYTRGFSHLFYAKQVGWLDVMLSVFFIAFPACFFRMLALKFCGQ